MPIPKEILSVERPKNTIVYAYGKNKDKYAVKKRTGCRYDNGRRIPVTGSTIGHIIDFKYVPMEEAHECVSYSPVELKDWADVTLCISLFSDILDELLCVYNRSDAVKIFCIAILRVCNPGIKDCELKEAYDTSFLSQIYPDVALSKNTVCKFINDLGKACSRIELFMRNRANNVGLDHHLLVDGTLKSDESRINTLSDFSRKAKTKGTRDISVMFAFDLEKMEPLCSKCFPGNMLDITSYEAFIADNGIKRGIIVADKGIPASAAKEHFSDNPDLHYLNPIKRNAKVIDIYKLHDYDGILSSSEDILYRKVKCEKTDKWLYSFRDAAQAAAEERDYLKNAKRKGTYSYAHLLNKQSSFGTLVLESDLDMTPEAAYKTYSCRWEIELVMRFYKSACRFDETRVQDDYSVIASEFCDFLSTILTFRLINKFDQVSLLEKMTYKRVMQILRRAKMVKHSDGDWQLIKTAPSQLDVLQKLGLIDTSPSPKRKPGRPPKNCV